MSFTYDDLLSLFPVVEAAKSDNISDQFECKQSNLSGPGCGSRSEFEETRCHILAAVNSHFNIGGSGSNSNVSGGGPSSSASNSAAASHKFGPGKMPKVGT